MYSLECQEHFIAMYIGILFHPKKKQGNPFSLPLATESS